MLIILFCSTDVITFEEYTGQVETTVTNNHSPSLNAVKHHPSGTDYARFFFFFLCCVHVISTGEGTCCVTMDVMSV